MNWYEITLTVAIVLSGSLTCFKTIDRGYPRYWRVIEFVQHEKYGSSIHYKVQQSRWGLFWYTTKHCLQEVGYVPYQTASYADAEKFMNEERDARVRQMRRVIDIDVSIMKVTNISEASLEEQNNG